MVSNYIYIYSYYSYIFCYTYIHTYIHTVIDTKVATKDPPSLAQPRAFSTHSSPEGWYERSGASPCSVLTASMAQVTGDPPYTTLAASHTRGFGREHA